MGETDYILREVMWMVQIVLTKKLAKSGNSVAINIPLEIAEAYDLKPGMIAKATIQIYKRGLPEEEKES